MVGDISIDWEGLDEIMAMLQALPQTVDTQVVPAALQTGAQSVQMQAKQVCPVRTGYLQSSITIRAGQDQSEIEIAAEAEYAGFVEAGTSRMAARRYMEQGLLSGMPDFVNALQDELTKALGG